MTALDQALPILLLIALGMVLRATSFVSATTIDEIKKIIISIVLPTVLFSVFLDLRFEPAYGGVVILVGAICFVFYGFGVLLGRWIAPNRPHFPFLMTGFEYGTLGVSLFGAAYGLGAMGYIAVVDLANEFFIWFFYVPMLMIMRDGKSSPAQVVKQFATSPVIIGLTGGLVLNALGLSEVVRSAPILSSVFGAMNFLTAMTVPLILIVVGYGISIHREGLGEVMVAVFARYIVTIPAALLINHFVIVGLLGLELPFQMALFSLMILPPSFILPVLMQKASESDKAYVTNVLAVSTVVTLVVFSIFLAVTPPI